MEYTNEVVERYESMVALIARKYTDDPELIKDLMQEGFIGLGKACEAHDPEKSSFCTYAYIKIWAQMQRYFNTKHAIVRVPRTKMKEILHTYLEMGGHDAEAVSTHRRVQKEEIWNRIEEHMPSVVYDYYIKGKSLTKLSKEYRDTTDNIKIRIDKGIQYLRSVL